MKKRSFLFIFAALLVAFSSCKKDDENLPFSKLSVEENKEVVESSAVKAAQSFDAMKDHDAIDAMVSLGTKLDASDPISSKTTKKSKVTLTVNTFAGLESGETGIRDIFAALATPAEFSEDPQSIQDVWDEVVGTYTWNFTAESWDYEANADAIVFLFPSTIEGTTNNATLTIKDYEGSVIASPIDEEYTGDLPVSLNLEMEIDGSVVLTYTFGVEYNDDGIPSSIASDLTIAPYQFSVDVTNNDEEISATYQFTDDGDIMLMIQGGIEGDFTQENIDENTYTVTDTWERTDYQYNPETGYYDIPVVVTETDEWEEVEIGGIIHTGRVKLQLYNISVVGIGNVTAIADSVEAIYPEDYWDNPDYDEQVATQRIADMMNEHLQLLVIDEDSRKKIADVEAYVVEDIDEWGTDYYIDFRMVFSDGSLVDMETYFEDGFEDFVAEINGIISDLNTKYEWEIDPVEY